MSIDRTGEIPIPSSHLDLLRWRAVGVLSTIDPEGQPHSALTEVVCASASSQLTATLDPVQQGDVERNVRVSVLVVDPNDTSRFIEVRGDAELIDDSNACRIHARRITLDAIHS